MQLLLEANRDQVPLGTFRFDSTKTRTIKIGSLKSAHVSLPGLPRVQAIIRVVAGQASIIDVGGGMSVNGSPVHRAVVTHGDAVSFGPVTLIAQIAKRVLKKVSAEGAMGQRSWPVASHGQALFAHGTQKVIVSAPFSTPSTRLQEVTGAARMSPAPEVEAKPTHETRPPKPPALEREEPGVAGHHPFLELRQSLNVFRPRRSRRAVEPARATLPPERPVSRDHHALELRLYWGETILDLRHYVRPLAITIGESRQADILLCSDGLPLAAFPLVRTVGDRYLLCVTTAMSGELEMGGRVQSLAQWCRTHARADPTLRETFLLPLSLDARAVVRWAGMSFALRFVPPPDGVGSPPLWQIDLAYLDTLLMSLLLHSLLLLCLLVYPYDAEQLEAERYEALVFVLNNPAIERRSIQPAEPRPTSQPVAPAPERVEESGSTPAPLARRRGSAVKVPERFHDFFASLGGSQRLLLAGRPGLTSEIASMIRSTRPGPTASPGFGIRGGIVRHRPALSLRTIGDIETRRDLDRELSLGPRPDRRAPAGIEIGSPVTSPGLRRAQIARVVQANREQIRFCYERQLYRFRDLSGRVETRWLIDPTGRVARAEVVSSTLENRAVHDCLLRRVRTWRFPEPAGGGVVEVNYPFFFHSE